MESKAYFMLSLCMKAGKIICGSESVLQAIRKGEAKLVIIAGDASKNTKKKFTDKSEYYKVKHITVSSKEELSRHIGKFNQAVFAVKDEGFAESIAKEFSDVGINTQGELLK